MRIGDRVCPPVVMAGRDVEVLVHARVSRIGCREIELEYADTDHCVLTKHVVLPLE